MKATILAALVVALAACGGPHAKEPSYYLDKWGGIEGTYTTILASNDCKWLNDMLVSAQNEDASGYAVAADNRMTDLGC